MLNPDGGVQVFGKFVGDLTNEPVLDKAGLNGQPYEDDQAYEYQQDGSGYFPKLSQGWSVLGVKVIKAMSFLSKFSTNALIFTNFPVALTRLWQLIVNAFLGRYLILQARVGYVIGF